MEAFCQGLGFKCRSLTQLFISGSSPHPETWKNKILPGCSKVYKLTYLQLLQVKLGLLLGKWETTHNLKQDLNC